MQFTLMPRGAHSKARDFVNSITPPFEAQYAVYLGAPLKASSEPLLIIVPAVFFSQGIANFEKRNMLFKFVLII